MAAKRTESTKLAGAWVLEAKAGEGATAVVHRARHEKTHELGALKLYRDPSAADEQRLIASLARRWGPRRLDGGRTEDGSAFVVMSWVEGKPLSSDVRGKTDPERAAMIVAHGVARGLAELHASGVWHGDVKPDNILVHGNLPERDAAEDRGATLIDLSLSVKSARAKGGTVRYAAPELLTHGEIGPASDVYSLGLALAEVIEPLLRQSPELAEAANNAMASHAWIASMLSTSPGARPSASFIADHAARALGLAHDPEEVAQSRAELVRRAYLQARAVEIADASSIAPELTGAPLRWVQETLAARAHGSNVSTKLSVASRIGLARWLVLLVGPAAADWPVGELGADDVLAERLLELAKTAEPNAWTFAEVSAGHARPRVETPTGEERIAWAVRELGSARPDVRAVAWAEDGALSGTLSSSSVVLDLSRALLRAGDVARAWMVLAKAPRTADALRADVARRRGDRAMAVKLAERAKAAAVDVELARAVLARCRWDAGDTAGADAALEGATDARACEVRALIALRNGAIDEGLRQVASVLASSADELLEARAWGIRGQLEHAAGRARASVEAFRRAVELTRRAGAVPEEATYLVGESAAASDSGDVTCALESATRAALLFERLGRRGESARAWLQRAATLATLGATHAADEAAKEALARATDVRTRAYARWAMVETRAPGDPLARLAALTAREELEHAELADRLLAAVRVLVWAELSADDVQTLDRQVMTLSPSRQCEWWGARARALLAHDSLLGAAAVLEGLLRVAHNEAEAWARGPALAAGVKLASRLGHGEAARRLEAERRVVADRLRATTPPAFLSTLLRVEWLQGTEPAEGDASSLAPAQVALLDSIVRSLATRDRLKTLLGQVLDALVLWTGVERGLLLLRAPDGKLVARAARNLAREDLHGDQLALSMTLAKRAMESGDTVVTTDALSSLGDVHASVHALRIRSVLAVPLISRGEALGVVYLDDRARKGAFGERERAWVRLLASQAAMAIADARDQTLLRREARRATRARARLAEVLAERETELDIAKTELLHAKDDGETRFKYDAIAGRSESMRTLLRLVDRVTTSDVPVLIEGESGTGKELIARAMHENGPRAKRAFVSENCGAVPEPLLESTLFGHVKGAFTGASQSRPGLFEVADGGTLFLDEIGEMPLSMQTKLLRVLQDGEVRAVGGEKTRKVDARLIAATHRNLEAMVAQKTFREDLFYRLNVIRVRVPPLRERPEDIPALVHHLIAKHAQGKKPRVSRAAIDRLLAFPWPGNVRQLENELRRALVLIADEATLDVSDLSVEVQRGGPGAARDAGLDLKSRVDSLERDLLREALKKTRGNQTKAAELLGLSRFGLQKMMKRLGLDAHN